MLLIRFDRLLLLLTDERRNVREEGSATEDQYCSQPVIHGERILKVPNTEQQRHKFTQSNHQGDSQRRTFRRQHKNCINTQRPEFKKKKK